MKIYRYGETCKTTMPLYGPVLAGLMLLMATVNAAAQDNSAVRVAPASADTAGDQAGQPGRSAIRPAADREMSSELVLRAEQWDRHRNGDSIRRMPAISEIVSMWRVDSDKLIEIRYPGGEEGELWVHELADWLVALGIPSDRLLLSPGSGAGDVIRFQLAADY